MQLYTRQLFIHILRDYQILAKVSTPKEQKIDDNIVAILGYLSVNYNRITLKEVALFFNYSEAYMSRILKKHTGKTFGMLIGDLQMKHAKELLENSDKALTDIAQEIGCFDYSHFSRKFKKEYDISPDSYRKNRSKIYTQKGR